MIGIHFANSTFVFDSINIARIIPRSESFTVQLSNSYTEIFTDSYTAEDVLLDWMDNSPVEMNAEELSLPQFELETTGTKPCKDMFKTGNWPQMF